MTYSQNTSYKRMPTAEIYTKVISEAEIDHVVGLISAQPTVREIILFGSSARGTTRSGEAGYRKPSDIDLLIVPTDPTDDPIALASELSSLVIRAGVFRPLDVIVAGAGFWENPGTAALRRALERDGKLLFKRDPHEPGPMTP